MRLKIMLFLSFFVFRILKIGFVIFFPISEVYWCGELKLKPSQGGGLQVANLSSCLALRLTAAQKS
jgi:hypothetical protein